MSQTMIEETLDCTFINKPELTNLLSVFTWFYHSAKQLLIKKKAAFDQNSLYSRIELPTTFGHGLITYN